MRPNPTEAWGVMKIPYITNKTIQRGTALFLCAGSPLAGSILLHEGFETVGENVRYTVTDQFTDGDADYFIRTDGETGALNLPAYTGYSGTWFWAAEDVITDNNPSGLARIDFTGVEITDLDAVRFSLKMAAGSIDKYDAADDFLDLRYRVDGGAWTTALSFQNDGTTFNSHLAWDADLDGIGEGVPLSLELTEFFSPDLPVSGTFLDVRIDTVMTSGGETVAFDDIRVAAVPEPALGPLAAGFLGAALLFLRKRLSTRQGEN